MYIQIQKRINLIMIITFLSTLLLLGFGYYVLIKYQYREVYLFLLFFIVLITNYTVVRFCEKNLEHHKIYTMLNQQKIALAYIHSGCFYKESRDSRFQKHFVYEFDIDIMTVDNQKISTKIYESLADSDLSCLPGYVYVTYDTDTFMVGCIPTMLLNMTPLVEPLVRAYEDKYNVRYLAVIRKQGLIIKNMSEAVSFY